MLVPIYSDTLTYSSASSMVNVTSDDGNELGGRFKLEYNDAGPTGWIDYDATASELTSALEQLESIPAVRQPAYPSTCAPTRRSAARHNPHSATTTSLSHHYSLLTRTPTPAPSHPRDRSPLSARARTSSLVTSGL